MQSEKHGTLEHYFLSSNKKPRNNEQEIEPNTILSSSLSTPEIQDLSCSSSLPRDQTSTDCIPNNSTPSLILSPFLNENSHRKFIPNDISRSCDDVPVQKKLATYPTNQQNRSFQSSWFNGRIWLEYSVQNDACYCYYCRHFASNQLNADDSFTNTGFNNWKRALEKTSGLIKHASCQAHIIATKNYLSYKQQQETNSNVLKSLYSCRTIQIRKNRDRLIKICSTLQLLARQMISFRGHEESEKCVNLISFRNRRNFFLQSLVKVIRTS